MSGNRAEAWFEIRYDSQTTNPNYVDGIAKRRYFEAEIFGLYNDSNNVSESEAKQVLQMYARHYQAITAYEALYGVGIDGMVERRNTIDEANNDYSLSGTSQVDTLAEALKPARDVLIDLYVTQKNISIDINGEVLVGDYALNLYDHLLGRDETRPPIPQSPQASNDLLMGGIGSDGLKGFSGDDVLYGEDGNDILEGGKGNDVLIGGTGLDTYIWNTGDGTDTIIDEDKQGVIIINNGSPQALFAVGAFAETEPGSGTWTQTMADGNVLTLTHHSPWRLVTADGSEIILGNDWQDGDFGIHLQNLSTPADIGQTVIGDLAPIDFDPNTTGIQTQTDELGNIKTDANQLEVNHEDVLYDSPGNDRLQGLGGQDLLDALRGGDDILEGGTDSDALMGGEGDDQLYGNTEQSFADLLAAGATGTATGQRGDLLAGGLGSDQLYGSNGNDALAGGDGADTLVGGLGDDVLLGDDNFTSATTNWSVTQQHLSNGQGDLIHKFTVAGAGYQPLIQGGNDLIYGGAGEDLVFAGFGNDTVDAGSDNDVVFGGVGHDVIQGQSGSDILIGDNYGDVPFGNDYISGGSGNDWLYGTGGDDYLDGGDGNDVLLGDHNGGPINTDGEDVLNGGLGNDLLYGGGKDDLLSGAAGNDALYGENDNDTLEGGEGNDYLDGNEGNDILLGGAGIDLLFGGNGNDYLEGGDGDDLSSANGNAAGEGGLSGEAGDDTIYGGAGNDELAGGEGLDFLDGGTGDDLLFGESGDDALFGGEGHDQLQGGEGNDSLDAGAGNDFLFGESGDDYLYGNDGDDELQGQEGSDILSGGAGADKLFGQDGNDTLIGGAGADYFDGGAGNDSYQDLTSEDTIFDNQGNDTLVFQGAEGLAAEQALTKLGNSSLSVKLDTGETVKLTNVFFGSHFALQFGNGTLLDLEAMIGNTLTTVINLGLGYTSGRLYGGAVNDILQGGFGNDTLDGYLGNDTLKGGNGNNVLNGGEGNDTLYGKGFGLGVSGNDTLNGGAGSDYLNSEEGNDVLSGGVGNDILVGGGGSDTYRFDQGWGQDIINNFDTSTSKTDVIQFGSGISAMDIKVSRSNDNLMLTKAGTTDQLTVQGYFESDAAGNYKIEDIRFADGTVWDVATIKTKVTIGSASDDILLGYSSPDILEGMVGNDQLYGYDGDDILRGGAGNDYFEGGTGNDVINGGEGNDFIRGDGGWDILNFDQGWGQDTIYLATDNANGEFDTISFGNGITLDDIQFNNISNAMGVSYLLSISRIGSTDSLHIADYFGSYFYINGSPKLEIRFYDGSILDLKTIPIVKIGTIDNDQLIGYEGSDNLQGIDGNDTIYGFEGNDILNGDGGNDLLDGGDGTDAMLGGVGNDTYVVDDTFDVVTETRNEGNDTIQSSVTYTLASNVENLTLIGAIAINGIGNAANNVLTGNSTANTLNGNSGNDFLFGLAGNDTLNGGNGDDYLDGAEEDDVLNGGIGVDKMYGGIGNDIYVVDNNQDLAAENVNEGTDTIRSSLSYTLGTNIEHLTLIGTAAIDGAGNADNNVLVGNTAANTLSGAAGDDTYIIGTGDIVVEGINEGIDTVRSSVTYSLDANIENLILIGTASIDGSGNAGNNTLIGNTAVNTLSGGAGNDIYVISTGDVVVEFANEGTDTVRSSVSHDLEANIENLTLIGTASIDGSGNANNNILIGNAAVNILSGGEGNDIYVISFGDSVVENANEGVDTVRTRTTYTLGANIENLILIGTEAIDGIGNDDNNILSGNEAANTLNAGMGNDRLVGGKGNDAYVFGRGYGTDTIIENDTSAGNTDVATFLSDITADQLWFQHISNNLEVGVIGTTDKLIVKDWYLGSANHVERFKTTGGQTLLDSQVDNLVSAMAAFAPPVAGQTTLPADYQATLNPVISANWQ